MTENRSRRSVLGGMIAACTGLLTCGWAKASAVAGGAAGPTAVATPNATEEQATTGDNMPAGSAADCNTREIKYATYVYDHDGRLVSHRIDYA